MSALIRTVHAREILDSRGNPTVEVEVTLADGSFGRAAVPSGASTGIYEALELRDDDKARFQGKGVLKAVAHVNGDIAAAVRDLDALDQAAVDGAMLDPRRDRIQEQARGQRHPRRQHGRGPGRGRLVPDAALPLSWRRDGLAPPRADVQHPQRRRPRQLAEHRPPGVHDRPGRGARTSARPCAGAPRPTTPSRASSRRAAISTGVGDEGGFAPAFKKNADAIENILKAIDKAGYKPGSDIAIVLDCAASSIYEDGVYNLRTEGKKVGAADMVRMYEDWAGRYPILSIEDGLAEDDWEGWALLNRTLGGRIQLVGDDLFVTNVKRLARGIEEKSANSVLIKLNQIGTLTETVAAIDMARKAGWTAMISHRSGETVDSFIADMSVAMGTGQIKTGAPCRGERVEKYNQLMRIEEELGSKAVFSGRSTFKR